MSAGLAAAVASMRLAVDEKTGIIRSVEISKVFDTEPRVFLCYAQPASVLPLAGIEGANQGGACSVDADRAYMRATGEAIERYCSAFVNERNIVLATGNELRSAGIDFYEAADFYPFAESQFVPDFPFSHMKPESKTNWVLAKGVLSQESAMVPASCVYVPYRFDTRIEPFTHMPISTGLACGPNLAYAVEKGILEVLERDALMIVWHRTLRTPAIDLESCVDQSPSFGILLDAARLENATWYVNLLTLDVEVPIISAVLINNEGVPKTSFGVAGDLDPLAAIIKAMEEALLSRLLINRADLSSVDLKTLSKPRTLRQHMLAYAVSIEQTKCLRFLTESAIKMSGSQLLERWPPNCEKPSLSALIGAAGLKAWYVDVTTPDVLDLGFVTARVLVPKAQPLDNDHLFPYLGGERLQSVPPKVGQNVAVDSWNTAPHPFP